jgi:nucleotide-binding universal stress UspA family protein
MTIRMRSRVRLGSDARTRYPDTGVGTRLRGAEVKLKQAPRARQKRRHHDHCVWNRLLGERRQGGWRCGRHRQAALLVVGTHQRAGIARLWQGSVSRGVLHAAAMSVACVPRGDAVGDERESPTFHRVLVPTDFSPLANRAIPVAYGLVPCGGVVHLLHVVTRHPGADHPDPQERLRALIPPAARGREASRRASRS